MYRFALAPINDMRISDLRIALLNYICAKQAGEPFIVRIEDGDKKRNIEGKDQEILEMLELFGITYSHLYYQSDNFKYHLQFASTLLDRKKAFICFCPKDTVPYEGKCEHLSSEEVLNNPNPFVIRMKKENNDSDSFVIMRTDKYPTPIFASACDDMLQGVSTIICEESHLNDAPKEEWIRKSIGYEQPIHYVYVPTFQCQKNERSVQTLLDEGFMPEAIINYLLVPSQILTFEEIMSTFDLQTLNTSASFEIEKLRLINREHIQKLGDMELSKRLGYACENIGKLAKIYTEEAHTTYEIKQKIDALFAKKEPFSEFEAESKILQGLILKAPYFEAFDDFKAYLSEKSRLEGDPFFKPLRFWLSGADHGPELDLVYPLIKNYLKEIVR
ncbi:glutamate--tRNA ligase family protein [Sulfurospirillum oryzae]|uniref:glutamate--tRNA ligase family protein n=1 Tax=Sulfurospirillum oryzae TaxID=2976535 RepID=UPI0021E81CD1|nr:glutamate--tRNA ligase family protein [Sulfurospirillum oryzae]